MLKELKSNLKNIKFEKDQPDGGYSGLPYIKTYENNPITQDIAQETARYSSDYPIRGGTYAIRAAAEDTIRIRKFLTDFPKGSNFTSKQIGLQRSNPLIETGKNGGSLNTRTYNLNSNLELSVLTAGTGTHYPRSGATPLTLLNDNEKYISIVGKKPKEENRLVNLYNTKILELNQSQSLLEGMGISSDKFQIMNYNGGPGSIYGSGETTISRATNFDGSIIDTNKAPKSPIIPLYIPTSTTSSLGKNIQYPGYDIKGLIQDISPSGSYELLHGIDGNGNIYQPSSNTSNPSPFLNTSTIIQIRKKESTVINGVVSNILMDDFRKDFPSGSSISSDYKNNMIPMITRIGIGSPGSRARNRRLDVNDSNDGIGQDKVNMLPILRKNYNENPENTEGSRDLIKFNFETIINDNPNETYRTHFRAFIKGFSDNHSADWDNKRYAGRGENLYNYQGVDRKVNFNFIISPQSKQEMKTLWQKLNFLASTLYPDYSPGTGFMRGNIHRLTVGDYLYRMPGVITSMNLSIDDNYSWEIGMDRTENGFDKDMMELPQIINVSISFNPILDFLPQMGLLSPILINDKVKNSFIGNKTENDILGDNSKFKTIKY